jgi:hypothetical protein
MRLNGFLFCCTAVIALLCGCGPQLAGGSSDSGNSICASIFTPDGEPAVGAVATLCPRDYLETDSPGAGTTVVRRAVTDASGYFTIDSIGGGDYFLEINDKVSNAVLIQAPMINAVNWKISFDDTLQPYAGIEGEVGPSSLPNERRYILAYGLDRRVPIGADGHFRVGDLPQGKLRFRVVSSDSAFTPVEIDTVTVASGKTASVPIVGWSHHRRILLNTTGSGAGVSAAVADFPVLIRLTGKNFNFDEAPRGGVDCKFTKKDNSDLAFTVERWDAGKGAAELWVRVDTIYGNNDSQYIDFYWGNPNAARTGESSAVFDTGRGFQGIWHLSDTSVDYIGDATWNNFEGRAEGMTEANIVDGIIGKARSFDGVLSSIMILNSEEGKLSFPQHGFYSLSAWAYSEEVADSSHAIISKGDKQYTLGSALPHEAYPSFWTFTEFQEMEGWETCKLPASTGVWTLVTGVRKEKNQYLYVNGTLVDSTILFFARPSKPRKTTLPVAIGKIVEYQGDVVDAYFKGVIDEVRIQSVSLSADWIRLCYMNQRPDDKLVVFK